MYADTVTVLGFDFRHYHLTAQVFMSKTFPWFDPPLTVESDRCGLNFGSGVYRIHKLSYVNPT